VAREPRSSTRIGDRNRRDIVACIYHSNGYGENTQQYEYIDNICDRLNANFQILMFIKTLVNN